MKKFFTFLFAALMSVASMWAQTETLLTTITATGVEQANYSTANVATVSFSYTAGGSSAYHALWGWWGYGWSATVNAAEGYTITKCVFYDDANRTATDSEAPFVVETTEEDKTPQVNGTPILEWTSKGIKKIDVYGYENPTTVAVTGVTLNQNEAQMTVGGETLTLTATVNPNNATDQSVSWSTSDANVATVDNGVVTAVAAGNATITVTTTDGSFTATCAVTVTAPEPAKYYVVGNMTEWAVDENYEMNPNIYAETEEYFYALDLTTTSEFKVVKVEGENQTWYPTGMGNNYGQNGEITEDAEYTIYFRPNYDGGENWFYNCIYVSKNEPEPTGVENVQTNQVPSNQVQSTKVIRNGILFIERDGKLYNAQGAEIK